jgi:hypothetical protein
MKTIFFARTSDPGRHFARMNEPIVHAEKSVLIGRASRGNISLVNCVGGDEPISRIKGDPAGSIGWRWHRN